MEVYRRLEGDPLKEGINVTETTKAWHVYVLYKGYVTRLRLPRSLSEKPTYGQEQFIDLKKGDTSEK
jgi:hypothetical protein